VAKLFALRHVRSHCQVGSIPAFVSLLSPLRETTKEKGEIGAEHDIPHSDNEALGRKKRADKEYEMKRKTTTPHLNFSLCRKQGNRYRKEIKRLADPYRKANQRRSYKSYDQKSKSGVKIQQLQSFHTFASAPERKSYLEPFQLRGLAKNTQTENPRVKMNM
jgi:hypothetical protein